MTRGSVLRVEDARELMLYVWEGALRVTHNGMLSERRLGLGESMVLRGRGVAVARALEGSQVTLSASAPTGYARRIVLRRSRGGALRVLYQSEPRRSRWWRWWQELFAPRARPTSAAL